MLRIGKLVFVLVFTLNQDSCEMSQKLLLTIYYESLCPDSKIFIVQQLKPTISLLHKYIKLRLVPFGKASSIDYGNDGFQCQHGPPECAGNMVQSCALDLMQERNDVEKVSYVACEMRSKAGSQGNMKCVLKAGLSADLMNQCVRSYKGIMLQLGEEYMTQLVNPKFIPTITINEVFDQEVQDSALINLTETLCSILKDTPPCARLYNKVAMTYVLY